MIKRNTLVLGDIQYLLEYRSHSDDSLSQITKQFVMFRNYNISNSLIIDNDIFFVPSDNFKNFPETIVWPISRNYIKSYSSNIDDYMINSIDEAKTFKEWEAPHYMVHKINSKLNNKFGTIEGPLIRSDKPDENKDWYYLYDYIKSSDDNIKKTDKLELISENDKNGLSIYKGKYNGGYVPADIECNEIRIYYPINRKIQDFVIDVNNVINDITFHYFCGINSDLSLKCDKEIVWNNVIYCEYVTLYVPNLQKLFKKNNVCFIEDLNTTLRSSIDNINYEILNDKFPLNLLLEPYYIQEDKKEGYYQKIYKLLSENSQYTFQNVPINIVFSNWTEIDDVNKHYIDTDNIGSGNTSFSEDNYFSISSKLGFDDDGIVSLISEFQYPNKSEKTLEEAYLYYNKVDNLEEYKNFTGWEESDFLDEWDNDFSKVSFNRAGYYIEISQDRNFTKIIYSSQKEETKIIQDFAFALNSLFENWKQYPEVLFCRAIFVDKYLSNIISGNIVVITKEWFKYLINDIRKYRLFNIIDKQGNMEYSNFNFIDKINCKIIKDNKDEANEKITKLTNKSNVIYKPLFFKVNEIQKIQIRKNVTQNIGINLGDFFTKVETFKIIIEDIEFTEYARTDVYVIFNINASKFTLSNGIYDIVNQNNEYISSGKYELY